MSPDRGQRQRTIRRLQAMGYLSSRRVIGALEAVPRERFVPPHLREQAWADTPLPIGAGQTISAPHMVAIMSEALRLREGLRVLEVGTGLGYHAAVTAALVGPRGKVTTIETVPELAEAAKVNLAKEVTAGTVEVLVGDGSRGHAPGSPYDRIYGTCAAREIGQTLRGQAAGDAILLFPMGGVMSQRLIREERKAAGPWVVEDLGGVAFVPLVGEMGINPR